MPETPNSNPETREPRQESEQIETTLENQEKEQAEREIKEWAKKTIQEWYDKVIPDYIFITETAGVPYGYVLKETWRNAYPDEDCPSFYRIDPRVTRERTAYRAEKLSGEKEIGTKKYFQKRIKKDNASIIVFDEGGGGGSRLELCDFKNKHYSGISMYRAVAEIHDSYKNYLDKKEGKIWIEWSGPSGEKSRAFLDGFVDKKRGIYNRPTSKIRGYGNPSPYRSATEDEKFLEEKRRGRDYKEREFTLTGTIVKHPEQRKRAVSFVKELRKIGKQAGEELHTELEINN